MITHGDCLEDAEYVAKLVREKMGIDNILINNIGTVIGSHTGLAWWQCSVWAASANKGENGEEKS